MRNDSYQRAMRLIASALVNSDLTPFELTQLAAKFNDPSSIDDLKSMITHLAESLKQAGLKRDYSHNYDSDYPLEKELYDLIQKKRVAKSTLFQIIREISPALANNLRVEAMPVRQIVQIISTLPTEDKNRFRRLLEDNKNDPYLKGIINRDKR